ncbi:PLA2 [Symbiodinium natans]|uniref:PLA2 protein n=1 Tax=Symbiodinium natans TaxID=878477 RepID=A0A812HYF4_9DINO|nr:PLA2 [Symbiodinium natans]
MEVQSRPPPPTSPPPPPEAYKPREAAFYGRLKEATMDLGAAHIDSLRAIFTSRVVQTRARLHGFTANTHGVQDPKLSGLRGNVLALGLGLLERTEAVLDLLLQLADTEGQEHQVAAIKEDMEEECELQDRRLGGFLQVPRVLSTQVFQSFAVPLTRSRTVKVTIIGVQDTCVSILQLLRVQELWQTLRGLHSWAQEKQKELTDKDPAEKPAVAVRAAKFARRGCEKLLGDRLGRLLDSHVFVHILGRNAPDAAEEVRNNLEKAAQMTGQAPGLLVEEIFQEVSPGEHDIVQIADLRELQNESGRGIHLVVKNSFFELIEEESPRELRRARSCDAVLTLGLVEQALQAEAAEATEAALAAPSSSSRRCRQASEGAETTVASERVDTGAGSAGSSANTSEERGERGERRTESGKEPAVAVGTAPASSSIPSGVDESLAEDALLNESSPKHQGDIINEADRMTVMLRNVPQEYSRRHILDLLDRAGFCGRYDFVYLPVDFTRGRSLGYALVGLISHDSARQLLEQLQGCAFPGIDPSVRCEASWSQPHRGLDGHIERYRNSPVMHPSMPDEYKPVIFANGERIDFPPPTKTIRAPRIRHPKTQRRPPGLQGPPEFL